MMMRLQERRRCFGNFFASYSLQKDKTLSLIIGDLSTIPVKKYIQGILNIVTSVKEKFLSSQRGSRELIRPAMGGREFSNANHLLALGEERRDGQKDQDDANETKTKGLVRDLKVIDRRQILQAKNTGAWMSVRSTTVSGTVFSATEFRYFLCARYNVSPLNLQSHCGRCGTAFGVMHTLSCSIGGLFIACHNEIRDKILYLAWRSFTPVSSIRAVQYQRSRSVRGVTMTNKRGEAWWSIVYGVDRSETSLMSNLTMLTCIPKSVNQWQNSWVGGKLSRKTSMVITVAISGNIFHCLFFPWMEC